MEKIRLTDFTLIERYFGIIFTVYAIDIFNSFTWRNNCISVCKFELVFNLLE